jgi:hypothetical protein
MNHLVVVDADDCDFLRNAQPREMAGVDDLPPSNVIAREHGDWPRQRLQPLGDSFPLQLAPGFPG